MVQRPRSSPFILLPLLLAGCSIKTPYVNVSQWPMEQRVMYYSSPSPLRIGVLPLMDHRPVHEQHGQRPRGMFLLLWNRRVGDYYTGDHIFGDQVANRLTDRLVGGLKAANAFAEIVPVAAPSDFDPTNAQQVSRLGQQAVVDYLVYGELEHFFGSQSQHTSTVLLPLYFINSFSWQDSKSLPWGKTAMACRLYDGRSGDMVWRRLIESDRTLPRNTDAMSEAAMYSFVDATGQLAKELRELSLQPALASR